MATFDLVDMAIAKAKPYYFRDPEPEHVPRHHLQLIADHDGSHEHPYFWGFTIFRNFLD
ncbi:hypothetical protein LZ30DRAFT_712490 [Colletotrichum cereale]|nr:hypothetical protein LZ30DRAFT_712490 [Colletotrichum cereale]